MSLHNTQKFDDNLGGGADQDLPLASPFSINDVVLLSGGLLTPGGVSEQEKDEQGSRSARVRIRSGKQEPERDKPKRIREPCRIGGQGMGDGL